MTAEKASTRGAARKCSAGHEPAPPRRLDTLAIAVQHRFVLALEPATLDRAVHAALLKRAVLPPPAAGAWVFARSGGTRAGRAANTGVALVVKRVVRYVVRPDVVPHLLLSPGRQGIHLDQPPMFLVELDLADSGPSS